MPRWAKLTLVALVLFSPGCNLFLDATHVVGYHVGDGVDDIRERKRNREWAETAWNQLASRVPYPHASEDYASGFKEGFAEYLYHGIETPPSLPPRKYRTIEYQSHEGYRAIEQWYAGYAHGTRTAQQNGTRRLITGPTPPDGLSVPVATSTAPVVYDSGYTQPQWYIPAQNP